MADSGNSTSQYWKFVRAVFQKPKYFLRTAYSGDGMSVDTLNEGTDSRIVYLNRTGHFSGQHWSLTSHADGTFRLHNAYTEEEKHLDATDQGIVVNPGNEPSQHWTFTKIKPT
jgi:hypothetical protein